MSFSALCLSSNEDQANSISSWWAWSQVLLNEQQGQKNSLGEGTVVHYHGEVGHMGSGPYLCQRRCFRYRHMECEAPTICHGARHVHLALCRTYGIGGPRAVGHICKFQGSIHERLCILTMKDKQHSLICHAKTWLLKTMPNKPSNIFFRVNANVSYKSHAHLF